MSHTLDNPELSLDKGQDGDDKLESVSADASEIAYPTSTALPKVALNKPPIVGPV